MSYYSIDNSSSVIEHFGIKGMKWGIKSRHSNLKTLHKKMMDSNEPDHVNVTYTNGRPYYSAGYRPGQEYTFKRDYHNYRSNMYRELLKEKTQKANSKGKSVRKSTVKRLKKKISKHNKGYVENAKLSKMYDNGGN